MKQMPESVPLRDEHGTLLQFHEVLSEVIRETA
jgi:hypothetical protein